MKNDDSAGNNSSSRQIRAAPGCAHQDAVSESAELRPGELEAAYMRVLFEQSRSLIAVMHGPTHVFEAVNRPYAEFVGRHRPLLGLPAGNAVPDLADQGYIAHADLAYSSGEATVGRRLRVESQLPTNGIPAERYIDFTFQPLFRHNGDVFGVFVQGQDVTEQEKAKAAVQHHASIDQLTGLPNRRLFRDRLELEIRRSTRDGTTFALLFLDLDRFKEVNDLRGHDTGDQLLKQVAQRLSSYVRSSDTVARLGGDEFAFILGEIQNPPQAELIVQKLLCRLAEPFHLNGNIAYVSASLGITLYPADAASSEELIRNSDQAMYAAKQAGRNQFRFFRPAMQDAAQHRLQLVEDLRRALAEHQLQVHYQPIVDLQSGAIVKAEALLRWRHPTLGFVTPAHFIPPAEESGLIHEIGDWVFEQAATWSQRWAQELGQPFPISVNCSPVQILARPGSDWLTVLASKGHPAPRIVLEITEGVLLKGCERVADIFYCFRASGIQLALDDFGTGYSSLSYLTQFEIDFLKIDQTFIRCVEKDERRRAIVESIIAMAHRLGMRVIAEGIETSEQEHILRSAGCNFGQGFLFSKALPPEQLNLLLAKQAPAQ